MPPSEPLVTGPAAIAAGFANPGITLRADTPQPEAIESESLACLNRRLPLED